ncbi:dCTP deaminase [Candidatus Riesia pediculicola]|nr:dCTP deaminase [Candidatus Riesia pediculicola]ARC54004.1 deoxycytidine triphosphate deaminase [Candidatus Riesia pediculicola]QOJ86630.1 dCTP deaminase [Candidatus Riesia pediculicola]
MRFCDKDIIQHLKSGKIYISPSPKIEKISGVTVDFHLGNEVRVFQKNNSSPCIDLGELQQRKDGSYLDEMISKRILLEDHEKILLRPTELIIAITFESLSLTNDIVGWIDGKSSFARFGLMVHVTSNRIDPGWNGKIVLEIINLGKFPLFLRPKMVICAISFEKISGSSLRPYSSKKGAKYRNQFRPSIFSCLS